MFEYIRLTPGTDDRGYIKVLYDSDPDDGDVEIYQARQHLGSIRVPIGGPAITLSRAEIANIPEVKALVDACSAFVEAWEKSHQLEKTDVALRMAKSALAPFGDSEPPAEVAERTE